MLRFIKELIQIDKEDDWLYFYNVKREQKKILKRQQLLEKGVTILSKKGYHGVGLQEILNEVQIPKGSFYNYFRSKEDFSVAVVGYYAEKIEDLMEMSFNSPEKDALTRLKDFFLKVHAFFAEKHYHEGCLIWNLAAEIGDTSEDGREALVHAVNLWRDKFATILTEAQSQGKIRRDIKADALADILLNTWEGALMRMKIEKSAAPLNQFMTQTLERLFIT